MGPSATIQHIRHIASQGLPAKMAVAAMVDALEPLIPTRTKIFFWVGEDSSPSDFYEAEPLMSALDAYFCQAEALARDPNAPSFDKLANSPVEYGGWRRFEHFDGWERSVLKNEVFGAYNIGNNLDFTIRDGGKPVGVLAIAREPGTSSYARSDIDTVLALRGHFLHAMNAGQVLEKAAGAEGACDGPAIALVGSDGTVVQAGPQAALLLHQLATPQPKMRLTGRPAPEPVREAMRRLRAIEEGHGTLAASLDVMTGWGRIRVIAHSRCPSGEAIVSLQRFVPRALCRIHRSAGLDLSPREREVAVAMCGTGDGDAIARHLGLSSASYREYARRIYRRLGVEGRMAIKDLLDS